MCKRHPRYLPSLEAVSFFSKVGGRVITLVSRYPSKGNCNDPLGILRHFELHIGLLRAMIVNLNTVPALNRAFSVSGTHFWILASQPASFIAGGRS